MEDNFNTIEHLLKSARSVDSKEVSIDEDFKDTLRERLYNFYLNSQSKGGSIMAKLKNIPLNLKVAIFSFAILFVVAAIVGGGVLLFFTENQKSGGQEQEILLAANLAFTDGTVSLRKSDDDRWVEALQGDVLSQGDSLKTGVNSRAVLELDSGDAVRLNADSEVRLASMDPTNIVIEQVKGESYNRVAASEENKFTVTGQDVDATALGTAYIFNSDPEKEQVKVYVYESDVKVSAEGKENDVAVMKKAVIGANKEIKVSDMTEKEYKKDFAKWGMEKDVEGGYKFDTMGPQITITAPKNGAETEDATIAVKGKVTDENALKKIIVNGKIYTTKDDGGKGFDPQDGTFNVNVSLNDGENNISVKAYDIYWNASKVAKVSITKTSTETTNSFYVVNASSPAAGKIYASWAMNGYSASKGFKLVAAVGKMPVYPGDKATYVDSSKREGYITGLPAGTYNVRVCIYTGSGCSMYTTNYRTVTVGGETNGNSVKSITLSGSGANVSWTVDGYSANGFKVVWSKNSGPTYPTRTGDKYLYFSDPNQRTATLSAFDGAGKYYVRVCEYLGGKCGVYSNQIAVTL